MNFVFCASKPSLLLYPLLFTIHQCSSPIISLFTWIYSAGNTILFIGLYKYNGFTLWESYYLGMVMVIWFRYASLKMAYVAGVMTDRMILAILCAFNDSILISIGQFTSIYVEINDTPIAYNCHYPFNYQLFLNGFFFFSEYQTLKLMQLSISQINIVCQSLLDNLQLDTLIPAPLAKKPPLYSAKAIKNTRRHMEDRHIIIDNFNSIFSIKVKHLINCLSLVSYYVMKWIDCIWSYFLEPRTNELLCSIWWAWWNWCGRI